MAWKELLTRLRASADTDMVRFADLLEMDLEGFTNGGSEGTTHGANYGNHITLDVQRHFESEIDRFLRRSVTDVRQVVKDLASFFADTSIETFKNPCNDKNRCPTGRFRAVRYVTIDTFLRNFVLDKRNLPSVGDPTRRDVAQERLEEAIERFGKLKAGHWAALANPKWNGRVWLTRCDAACPHEIGVASRLSDSAICDLVVQQMGLLGVRSAQAEKIGMVAIEYVVDSVIYRPTVLDALPYLASESVMAFYPGPKGKEHGETLPLDASLSAPGNRLSSGVVEWIHAVESVRFGEVPPGGLKDPWHCRVAWKGLW